MLDFGALFDWNLVTGCLGPSFGCRRCACRGEAVQTHAEAVLAPLALTDPQDLLAADHGDLFAPAVPDGFIHQVLAVVAALPERQVYLSTKYIRRAGVLLTDLAVGDRATVLTDALASLMPDDALLDRVRAGVATWPLPNLHLGVSVETHCWLLARAPWLLQLRVAHRFLLARPLLGGMNLDDVYLRAAAAGMPEGATFDFVVLGAETGDGAPPLVEAEALALEAQCDARGIPHWRLP